MSKFFSKTSLVIILISIIPSLYYFIKFDYIPRDDQFILLQGAYRLSQGLGLTAALDDNRDWNEHKDLSQNNYHYISNWPPGYSLSIALLFKLGLSTDVAPKVFHIFFLLIGLLFWLSLLKHFYEDISYLYQFLFLLIALILLSFIGDSNLVLWAIFPCIIFLVLNIDKKKYYPIIIGILIAFLITFRYQSLFLIGGIFLYVLFYKKNTIKQFIWKNFILFIIPILTYLVINYLNRLWGKDLYTEQMEYQYGFNFYWFLLAIKSFTTEIFFLDRILNAILSKFLSSGSIDIIINIVSLIMFFIYCWILYTAYKKEDLKEFVILFIYLFISNFLLLLFLSIVLSDSDATFTAINVSRYYRLFITCILLFAIVSLKDKLTNLNKIYNYIIVILFFVFWIFLNYYYYKGQLNINEKRNQLARTINNISYLENEKNIFVISLYSIFSYFDNGLHYRFLLKPNELYFSKRTLLIVINEDFQKKYFSRTQKEKDNVVFRDFDYEKFIKANGLTKFKENIYYKIFQPFEQIKY